MSWRNNNTAASSSTRYRPAERPRFTNSRATQVNSWRRGPSSPSPALTPTTTQARALPKTRTPAAINTSNAFAALGKDESSETKPIGTPKWHSADASITNPECTEWKKRVPVKGSKEDDSFPSLPGPKTTPPSPTSKQVSIHATSMKAVQKKDAAALEAKRAAAATEARAEENAKARALAASQADVKREKQAADREKVKYSGLGHCAWEGMGETQDFWYLDAELCIKQKKGQAVYIPKGGLVKRAARETAIKVDGKGGKTGELYIPGQYTTDGGILVVKEEEKIEKKGPKEASFDVIDFPTLGYRPSKPY